jgi:hypothetical protein
VAVTNPHIKVSTGLIHLVVRSFLRNTAIRVFTLIKRAPRQPPTTPRNIEQGIKYKAFTSSVSFKLPNFRVEPDHEPPRFPSLRFAKRAKEKVPRAHAIKTFQIIENLQKVFGFDISYENNVPPIGAPKATLTPAEAPAATKTRLFSSF